LEREKEPVVFYVPEEEEKRAQKNPRIKGDGGRKEQISVRKMEKNIEPSKGRKADGVIRYFGLIFTKDTGRGTPSRSAKNWRGKKGKFER